MTDKKEHIKHSMKSTAPADCVTEIRIGNSVLVVSGFFKQSATETAADKMAKVANFESWIFFKWVFKTFLAVTIITNCFNITMAVFDVSQQVIAGAGGIIAGSTAIDSAALDSMQATVEAMDLGPMLGLYLQSFIVQTTMWVLGILIFVIVYGRMIEIYLMVSLAPIPFSTFGNREQSQIGQNYLRSLFAIGFQGFLILVCVGIYAVLIQSVAFSQDIIASLWGVVGYTVLLCFTLFKTGGLAKSVLNAH